MLQAINKFSVRSTLLGCLKSAGMHPDTDDGWLMVFVFPNGLTTRVGYTSLSNGIHVSTWDGDQKSTRLMESREGMSGEEVFDYLFDVMKRSAI